MASLVETQVISNGVQVKTSLFFFKSSSTGVEIYCLTWISQLGWVLSMLILIMVSSASYCVVVLSRLSKMHLILKLSEVNQVM